MTVKSFTELDESKGLRGGISSPVRETNLVHHVLQRFVHADEEHEESFGYERSKLTSREANPVVRRHGVLSVNICDTGRQSNIFKASFRICFWSYEYN